MCLFFLPLYCSSLISFRFGGKTAQTHPNANLTHPEADTEAGE